MISQLYFGTLDAVRMHREANLMLTCIIDSVPHLKTADGAGFVFGVATEDQLKHKRGDVHLSKPVRHELRF